MACPFTPGFYPQMRLVAALPGSRRTSASREEQQSLQAIVVLKADRGKSAAISGPRPAGRRLHICFWHYGGYK
jgi:hypothetical protein